MVKQGYTAEASKARSQFASEPIQQSKSASVGSISGLAVHAIRSIDVKNGGGRAEEDGEWDACSPYGCCPTPCDVSIAPQRRARSDLNILGQGI